MRRTLLSCLWLTLATFCITTTPLLATEAEGVVPVVPFGDTETELSSKELQSIISVLQDTFELTEPETPYRKAKFKVTKRTSTVYTLQVYLLYKESYSGDTYFITLDHYFKILSKQREKSKS